MKPSCWIPSKQKIGGYKSIEHEITKEFALIGKYGEIWKFNEDGCFKVLVEDHLKANQLARKLSSKSRYKSGDEAVFTFSQVDFETVAEVIAVYKSQERQVQKASKFGTSTGSTPLILSKKTPKRSSDDLRTHQDKKNGNSSQKQGVSDAEPKLSKKGKKQE